MATSRSLRRSRSTRSKTTTKKSTPKKTTKKSTPKRTTKKSTTPKKSTGKKRPSTAKKEASRKKALSMKRSGKGIFQPKTQSAELKAVTGSTQKMPRTEVNKAIWRYIKRNNLNNGRVITPDAKLGKVLGTSKIDMLKMPKKISEHLS